MARPALSPPASGPAPGPGRAEAGGGSSPGPALPPPPARPGPALPASFRRTEAPGLGGRRARLPRAEGRRGPRGWAEVKAPVGVRLQASGLPGRAVPRKRALSRGVQGCCCCCCWWCLRGGVAALARGWGKGNPGRGGTGERAAFPAVPRWPRPRPRPRWLQRQGAAVSRAGTVVAEGR